MPPLLRCLPLLGLLSLPLGAAQQCLVIGDSLTKEYEVEFPALYPANPASWSARNWAEILHEHRRTWFDLARFTGYADPRLTGHEHNWAFPGATTTEIKSQLSNFANYYWWVKELEEQIEDTVERVVVFAGGNDVDSYYGPIYNGATASTYTNPTRDNLKWIVDYIRSIRASVPIVLVSVPHLGCAPDVQAQYPTDAVKTARVTAALDALNAQLASFAQSRNIGFVPGVYEFTRSMIGGSFRIGGIEFYQQADPDARPRYVFSGDGFHPGTCAHARIAQLVIDAFRAKYPATNITPLGDREIVEDILGLDPDLPFQEWIATQGVPAGQQGQQSDPDGDGLVNVTEFALEGLAAGVNNAADGPWPVLDRASQPPALVWHYRLRPVFSEWAVLKAQTSLNLQTWQDAGAAQTTANPDGSWTVRVPASGRLFGRLQVRK